MMNGAAMNCRQDQLLRSLHKDSRGLQGAGYHLQMNDPLEQNFPAQHSKAIHSQSDHFVIDGSSQYLQTIHTVDTARPTREDPRSYVQWTQTRKPIDLPVPQFEIDTNCVGVNLDTVDDSYLNQNNTKLDLDTRIDLLIKSKALSGMHPIFSELNESSDDSVDSILSISTYKVSSRKTHRSPSPIDEEDSFHKIDNPDKPLSRPPSPFLSKDKYLFWFNKAIEIKEQAKAQEQELIEKARKKLLQDSKSCGNSKNKTSVSKNGVVNTSKEKQPFFSCLLGEISKEMKELIKQQFINDVLENTIATTLECWWDKEEAKKESLSDCQNLNSTFQEQESKNTFKESLNLKISQNDARNPVTNTTLNQCDKQDFNQERLLDDQKFEYEKSEHSHPKLSSQRKCRSTSITMRENLNFEKANLEDKSQDINCEATVETNKECNITDFGSSTQNILSTINSPDNQLESKTSSIVPRNKEDVKSNNGTDLYPIQESQTTNTIKEKYFEPISLSESENKVSTITEYPTDHIKVPTDCKLNFTKPSNSDSLSIIQNELNFPPSDTTKQECAVHQSPDISSSLTDCNKNLQTHDTSSFVSESTEEKSSDVEYKSLNTNVDEHISKKNTN